MFLKPRYFKLGSDKTNLNSTKSIVKKHKLFLLYAITAMHKFSLRFEKVNVVKFKVNILLCPQCFAQMAKKNTREKFLCHKF